MRECCAVNISVGEGSLWTGGFGIECSKPVVDSGNAG